MIATARRAGDLVFVSGQAGSEPDGGDALDRVAEALESVGATLGDVVDVISFHTDVRDVDRVLRTAAGSFPTLLAWTPIGMTGMAAQDARVSIRAIAQVGAGERELLFFSSRGDGESPDPQAQAEDAYAQARRAVEAAGGTMADVIDICSFHLDPRGMVPCEQLHNDMWAEVPLDEAPAWTAIGAPALHRPGQLVQYRMIADLSSRHADRQDSGQPALEALPHLRWDTEGAGRLIGIAGEVASDAEGNITTPGRHAQPGQLRIQPDPRGRRAARRRHEPRRRNHGVPQGSPSLGDRR